MTRRLLAAALLVLVAGAPSRLQGQTSAEWQDVIRHLRHPDPRERLDAVNQLAQAGYRGAAEAVAPLLTDPDDRVQGAAIDAELAFFLADRPGGGRFLNLGGGSRTPAQEAFEAGPLLLGGVAVPRVVLEQMLAAVRDENSRVRFDAIHAFGFLAEAPLDADLTKRLSTELDHYDPIIRAATARVVGRLRAAAAVEAIATAMVDSNPIVRRYATEATGLIDDEKSLATLRDQVEAQRGDMVEISLLAIARIGDGEDLALFRERMQDRAPGIRRAAVEGLGRLVDRESMPAIEALLKDDRAAEVRLAAACALQRMGQEQSHVIAPMLVLREVNAQARDCLFEIGPAAVPGIHSTLRVATDSRHRFDLIQLIGYLGTMADVAALEPMAGDPDVRVQRAVGHAIARLRR